VPGGTQAMACYAGIENYGISYFDAVNAGLA